MPYRGPAFERGTYYHVYNRALAGELLFRKPANYRYCLRLARLHAGRHRVSVVAYCLMPNHYHFLLRQEGDQPLSGFLCTLFNAYVQAVNRQWGRRGPLFEGRFRYVRVDRDDYVWQLCRYIHLNPVKAGLAPAPEEWPYSDFRAWIGLEETNAAARSIVAEYWGGPEGYRRFVSEGWEEQALKTYLLE
jgi:REP element-mobilizing transposase RayT